MRRSFLQRHSLVLVVYGMILILMLIGAMNSERFLSLRNLTNVLRQAAYLGTAALGEMLVILTAGIDLSIGSLVKLCVLVSAILMDGNPDNVWMAVILTLGLGLLVGLIHAFLINEFNLSPFVVTFASLFILQGISLTITTKPIGRASRDFLMLYSQKFLGVPIIVYYFIFITLLIMFLLRKTVFGKHIYAIGGNLSVAQLSGIPVKRVRYGVYGLCSVLAASTGLLWLMRMGVGDPVIGKELELNAIIAVVIGGTSLFGGRGTVTFASLFILQGISLTITTKPIGRASRDFLMLYSQKFLGVPIIVYYFIFITLLIMFLLRKTVFGKHIYAIGGNLSVAQLSGIPVKRVRYGVYGLCSVLAASTGLLWLMRMGVGDPVIGKELELNAIIAVVIGGTSLFGGRGTVTGVLGGILLLTFTDNLLVVLGVNQFISGLIKGIIFVAAVALYKQADRARGGFSGP